LLLNGICLYDQFSDIDQDIILGSRIPNKAKSILEKEGEGKWLPLVEVLVPTIGYPNTLFVVATQI
jgi:hypothetical protein